MNSKELLALAYLFAVKKPAYLGTMLDFYALESMLNVL